MMPYPGRMPSCPGGAFFPAQFLLGRSEEVVFRPWGVVLSSVQTCDVEQKM